MSAPPTLHAHRGIAAWSGGNPSGPADIWFLHAFADSHACFGEAFRLPIAQRWRLFLLDLPGHGASPPRPDGLTVEDAARACCDLIGYYSASRQVVLVAHSMASIIATSVARELERPPRLLISIEGNLTPADAYLSGQAAAFADPQAFYRSFSSSIFELVQAGRVPRRFGYGLELADPMTLWTLGRSIVQYAAPGMDLLALTCPILYYWDPASTTDDATTFLSRHRLPRRRLDALGHWPMVTSPARFYAAVAEDVQSKLER